MNNLDNPDLNQVWAESRVLAIRCKHDFIHYDHCFVAMLHVPCLAQKRLTALDPAECLDWLQKQYPATGSKTMEDTIALTLRMERIVSHTVHIAQQQGKSHSVDSVHLLMAMLSYDNEVSQKIKKAGIIYEDIADGLPKQPLTIPWQQLRKPSFLARLFDLAPTMQEQTNKIHKHADDLYHYQQYEECIATCHTGLAINPGFSGFKFLLINCWLKKRDYHKAINLFLEIIEFYPHASNYLWLSFMYDEIGEYQKVEEILQKSLTKEPDNDELLNSMGFNLYRQGRYTEAVPYYEKAIQANPSFAYPYDNLGFVKHKLGQTAEAFTLIDQSLELDKGNSYAYMFKGRIYLDQGNKPLALEQFQLALRYGFTETYGEEVVELIRQCQ
jgi:tetratricopeptide (TPR) repeat protein